MSSTHLERANIHGCILKDRRAGQDVAGVRIEMLLQPVRRRPREMEARKAFALPVTGMPNCFTPWPYRRPGDLKLH